MTQVDRLYQFVKSHPVFTKQEVSGLGISEENARIYDLRDRFNCTCKTRGQGQNLLCNAKEHIVSVDDCKFTYIGSQTEKVQQMTITLKTSEPIDIEKKLYELRRWYVREQDPVKRKMIERIGKMTKMCVEKQQRVNTLEKVA